MPEYIGNVEVPEIAPSGTFPLTTDFPHGCARRPTAHVHRFGSANAKIEQRFWAGDGARRFTVSRRTLRPATRKALLDFWLGNQGAYGAFYYNAPNDDGNGTTQYVCRFEDQNLTFESFLGCLSSLGVTLAEIPSTGPTWPLNATCYRFPSEALEDALLAQAQQIVPLVKITPTEGGYPALRLSDRRCTIGGELWQPRLLEWGGIAQGMGGESDEAEFAFGDADGVMTAVANQTDLYYADVELSLYHVGSGVKIQLWKGTLTDWQRQEGDPRLRVKAMDGLHELRLAYPRKINRYCWKRFDVAANGCPYAAEGVLDPEFPEARADRCDKSFAGPNGCRAHSMNHHFGGVVAQPQSARIKDNSTGRWGLWRADLTATSLISDSVYAEILQEVYCKITDPLLWKAMPVKALIVEGRDESDFYAALGAVGRGPLGSYGTPAAYVDPETGETTHPCPHKLDGQPHHGWHDPKWDMYGLRLSLGPEPNDDPFSLGQGGAGAQSYGLERAAGIAFAEIRRSDEKGLQLNPLAQHSMEVGVRQGLGGWKWTAPGSRSWVSYGLDNPVWIAVNVLLRALGLEFADAATQENYVDVAAAAAAAAICDQQVSKIIGSGVETQFTFNGFLRDQKAVRDWVQEILNNCLGYYTFASGKLRIGVRANSSVQEAFNEGNVLWDSLSLAPLKPTFNAVSAQFANAEYSFQGDSVGVDDLDHALLIGKGQPLVIPATINLCGASSKSQAARIAATRLREETGGITPAEWRYAREVEFRTTVLALAVEPGMVCSLAGFEALPTYPATHPENTTDPQAEQAHYLEFRVTRWTLNGDFSVTIRGRSTHNDVYALVAGPKPADALGAPVPLEEDFPPANWGFEASTDGQGHLRLGKFFCGTYGDSVHMGLFEAYHVEEAEAAFGCIAADMNASQTNLSYAGPEPTPGEWVQVDQEIMEIVEVTPGGDPWFGTAVVIRGALGTTPAPHARQSTTISAVSSDTKAKLTVGTGLAIRPGDHLVLVATGNPQQPVGDYDPTNGALITILPMAQAAPAVQCYADPRLWRLKRRDFVVVFQPRFFRSPSRSTFAHEERLEMAGLALVRGRLENTRGVRSAWETRTFAAWPWRLRTLGNDGFHFARAEFPSGETPEGWAPLLTAAAQCLEAAWAETPGGTEEPVEAPRAVASLVKGDWQETGSIQIGGSIGEDNEISVYVEGEGNNFRCEPWLARDHGITGASTPEDVAESLFEWLLAERQFPYYFTMRQTGDTIYLVDVTGRGGSIKADVAGGVTAACAGTTSYLGVLSGRRYATCFWTGTYRSDLSLLSQSTGPTGGAGKIQVQDLPTSADERVTTVEVYATPDGQQDEFHKIGEVAVGENLIEDANAEATLLTLPHYPGATQPPTPGKLLITATRDGQDWFELCIPAGQTASQRLHGYAIGPLPRDSSLSARVANSGDTIEARMVVE